MSFQSTFKLKREEILILYIVLGMAITWVRCGAYYFYKLRNCRSQDPSTIFEITPGICRDRLKSWYMVWWNLFLLAEQGQDGRNKFYQTTYQDLSRSLYCVDKATSSYFAYQIFTLWKRLEQDSGTRPVSFPFGFAAADRTMYKRVQTYWQSLQDGDTCRPEL